MYKVSVIIPVYNVSQYLHEALESVIRQTLKDIEIICVNDGSTDDSLDIIQEYAKNDNRIKVITGPNCGYGSAINKGLDTATGEYIGILEPDDYLALTMYEDLYKIAKENDLDVIKADFYRFSRNENGDMKMTYILMDRSKKFYGEILDPYNDFSLFNFTMNIWCGIYRRNLLEEHHIRLNETPGASFQDNSFFFLTSAFARRAMIVNVPYYRNRRDNPNSSIHNKEKVYALNIEYDYIRDILMQDQEIWEHFKGVYHQRKYYNYLFTLDRIDEQYKEPYIQRMSTEYKRAKQLNEFQEETFSPYVWKMVNLIMENPKKYYETYYKSTNHQTEQAKQKSSAEIELENIKNSTTWKVGRFIMAIPCAIKDKLTR